MRLSLLCTLATTLILCASTSTSTSTYAADAVWKPRKAVEIVVGAQAGGANDRMGRVLQKILTDTNNWTIDLIGAKALPGVLEKEYTRLRKTLTELGMVQ